MRKRYLHCVYPHKDRRQPGRCVSLAVSSPAHDIASSVEWSACWWRAEHGRPRPHKQQSSSTRSAWWELVQTLLTTPGEVWCFSDRASSAMNALKMWERVEEGTLRICGNNAQAERAGRRDSVPLVSDYMILHDPPFYIQLAVPGRPGRLHIVDIRNYGLILDTIARDVTSLAEETRRVSSGMLEALAKSGGPSLCATAATTSWNWWRLGHLKHTVLVHNNEQALHLERQAIHGGRCECYVIGDAPSPVWQLDIRSCYPSVAMHTGLPARLLHYGVGSCPPTYPKYRQPVGTIADVTVTVHEPVVPCKLMGLTCYPVGTFRTVLCGPELWLVENHGRVEKWHQWACYELDMILKDYLTHIWRLREHAIAEGEVAASLLYKSVMNSVIGKFCQKGRFWEHDKDSVAPMPYGSWYQCGKDGRHYAYRSVAWNPQKLVDQGETADSCPAVAAWIYSAARVRLWNLVCIAGRGNVWYCDTDSLFVDSKGYDNISYLLNDDNPKPGDLRTVAGPGPLTVYGIKHYSHCGIMRKAGPVGLKPAGVPDDIVYVHPIVQRPYKHGEVGPDNRVSPWEVE